LGVLGSLAKFFHFGQQSVAGTALLISSYYPQIGWLGSRVVIVLDSGAEGPGSNRSREARDSEWQWHLLGHMQVCTSLQTDNHASTPPLSFLQAGCPFCHPTNSVKALKAKTVIILINIFV